MGLPPASFQRLPADAKVNENREVRPEKGTVPFLGAGDAGNGQEADVASRADPGGGSSAAGL
jgi:hypothetical protein